MGLDLDQIYIAPSSGGGGGSAVWGDITGDLDSQTDLQTALDGKVDTTTEVNGQALSSNVTLVTDDIAEDGAPTNLWFTDERAQDAIGSALLDTNTVDLIYTDIDGTISADVLYQDTQTAAISEDASGLKVAVVYQDTNTVNLGEDASGLKAEVLFSAATDNVASDSTGVYVKRQSTVSSSAPTVSDDSASGILVGHIWLDAVAGQTYVCLGNNTGGAKWKQVAGMYREMDIPANAMTPSATDGAAAASVELANKFTLEVLDFETAVTTYANFSMRFPSVAANEGVNFEIHWMGDTTASSPNVGVTWVIDYYLVGNGSPVSGTFVSSATVSDVATTITANNKVINVIAPTFMTPAAGQVCYFRVYRDTADAGDAYTGVARLERVVVQYREDTYENSAVFS